MVANRHVPRERLEDAARSMDEEEEEEEEGRLFGGTGVIGKRTTTTIIDTATAADRSSRGVTHAAGLRRPRSGLI